MLDIHNSVDYIIEFLLNNDFERIKTLCRAIYFNVELNIHILIDIQNCYIYIINMKIIMNHILQIIL